MEDLSRYERIWGLVVSAMAINAQIEGMKIANIEREQEGKAFAYTEIDFVRAANELDNIARALQQ